MKTNTFHIIYEDQSGVMRLEIETTGNRYYQVGDRKVVIGEMVITFQWDQVVKGVIMMSED